MKSANKCKPPGPSKQAPLEQTTSYRIKGKTFVVQPVFKEDGRDTIGTILMRLMQSDRESI